MEWPKEQHTMDSKAATQAVRREDVHPARKILAVVTVGRYTCAGKKTVEKKKRIILFRSIYDGIGADNSFSTAPLIEICRVLHGRGHEIQFAVLKGWERILAPHSFISKVHLVGRDLTVAEDDELYRLLDASSATSAEGRKAMVAGISLSKSNSRPPQ